MPLGDVADLIKEQNEIALDLMNQTDGLAFMFECLAKHSESCCDEPLLGVAVTLRQMAKQLSGMYHELDLCITSLLELKKEETEQ